MSWRGWTPPAVAAVYAIVYKPDLAAERYAVIYVDHSADLTTEHFPFSHPRAGCWVQRAGDRYKLFICTYEVPGGLPSHREQIVRRAHRASTARAATPSSTTRRGRTSG